jgi:hypothetical protein
MSMDETAADRARSSAGAVDVSGRLEMSLDGSPGRIPIGFQATEHP